MFNTLAPYFIIECKNELKKKPDNNYCNKLLSIIDTNDAKLGIIWARKDVTSTCFTTAREHYLTHSRSKKDQIIITFSDEDLKEIIGSIFFSTWNIKFLKLLAVVKHVHMRCF